MVINSVVDKLLKARFIRDPKWIANVVLIKKVNRSWRVYVDLIDWNMACPKNNFLLPKID